MKRQNGYAIPLSLCVGSVTLLMGIAATQLTAGDLQNASQQYYQERARQMADYGLERCLVQGLGAPPGLNTLTSVSAPTGVRSRTFQLDSVSGAHDEDEVTVTVYDNRTGTLNATAAGCPIASVPVGFEYWVAEGRALDHGRVHSSARLGAMVRHGDPVGGAGAQVRYLTNYATGLVDFVTQDRATMQPAPNEIVFATNSTTLRPAGSPNSAPLDLNQVGNFGGKARIPVGKPDSWVRAEGSFTASSIDREGGSFNIPDYAPPGLRNYVPAYIAGTAPAAALTPGRYGRIDLPAGSQIDLAGAYHVQELVVQGGSTAAAALLHSVGPTRLFVDKITLVAAGSIALKNSHVSVSGGAPSARGFQIYLKPTPQVATVNLEFSRSSPATASSVLVVAPNFKLKVKSDALNRIIGSFCCEELDLLFDAGGSPRFVYDVSANQARRARPAGGAGDAPPPTEDGGTATAGLATSGGTNPIDGGGTGEEPETGEVNPDPGGNTRTRHDGPGPEPFILSKQPL